MIDIESGLRTYLLAQPGVSGRVGTRYYPNFIPQDAALPAIAARRISGNRLTTHAGPAGFTTSRIQLTLVGTYEQVRQLSLAVRQAVDGISGVMGGVTVHQGKAAAEIDGYNQATGSHIVYLDLILWHKEL